jgi:DNA-binding response OmpR family regulator
MNPSALSQAGELVIVSLQCRPKPARRILVVEDDDGIRHINAVVLAHSGYQVDAAEDGAAAWDRLQQNRYDLMVTDNDMPKVSGVELLHKLHAAHIALPVILATGTLPAADFTQYPWIQQVALLLKPYSFHELLGTVRNVLRATDPSCEEAAPPNWQTGPMTGDLQC